MQFQRLARLEASVLSSSNNNFKTQPFSIPIKDEDKELQGFTLRPGNGFTGYFYDEQVKKDKIVVHFTAGNLKGDLLSLTSEERGHVSVPFVIGRDGKIFQLFSSAAWSYHLGKGAKGGNTTQSKKSIGIELSNFGPLTLRDGQLETIYSRLNGGKKHVYCGLEDTDQYIKLDKPFRGYQYFANFTSEQYDALITLLRYLTTQYDIPRKFLPKSDRFKTTDKVVNFCGIVSHVNYRESGKWDIGPAFDWDRVINGVKGSSFSDSPTFHITAENADAELKKAQEEFVKAQKKLKDVEAQIKALKPGTSRGRRSSAPKILTSEAEVNKVLEGSRTRGGRGRGAAARKEPKEDTLESMSKYQLG